MGHTDKLGSVCSESQPLAPSWQEVETRQALGQKRGVAMENLEGFGGVKWVKAFEEMGVMLKLGQGLRGKPSKTG